MCVVPLFVSFSSYNNVLLLFLFPLFVFLLELYICFIMFRRSVVCFHLLHFCVSIPVSAHPWIDWLHQVKIVSWILRGTQPTMGTCEIRSHRAPWSGGSGQGVHGRSDCYLNAGVIVPCQTRARRRLGYAVAPLRQSMSFLVL